MNDAMEADQTSMPVSRKAMLFGSVMVVTMIVVAVLSVVVIREREIEGWRRQMSSMSLILADQTSQTMVAAYLILDSVTEHVRDTGVSDQEAFRTKLATPAVHEMLRGKVRGLPQIDVASIIAANGDNINFTRAFPVPPINLAERDYFQAHLGDPKLGDFISQPVRNKGNGKWTFYISRRLSNAQGKFLGMVLIGISVEVINRFYERVARDLGEGATISLFRSDLTLLTRWPHKDDVIGTVNRSGSAFEIIEVQKKKESVLLSDTPRFSTGKPVLRLTAVHTSDRYPLIVVMVVTEDLFLANWRRSAGLITGVTFACVLALLLGLQMLVRNLRRREADMKQMEYLKTQAEAANLAKSRFLATMSHEIRTPMNGILGMAQMLLLPNLQEDHRNDYARTILSSGQTLLTLLNDILDLSKIEAGKFQLESAAFAPEAMMHETTNLFAGTAQAKGLQLNCQWQGATDQRYLADSNRLRQMLSNLVGNAIKFTRAGQVRIEAKEVKRDKNTSVLEFEVSDTGIGIPANKLDLLFKPFSQTDSSTTREFGGTGLGLSIVINLAKAMGGDVGVSSEPGKGSRFWFRVKVGNITETPNSRKAERLPPVTLVANPENASNLFSCHVLVVEDNLVNCMVIESLLNSLGVTVSVAHDGQQAVEFIEQHAHGATDDQPKRLNLILMDLHMPVLDGYGATERIRQWEADNQHPRLPIIALTADAFEEDRKRCLSVGMDDFLTKPISIDAIKVALGQLCPRGQAQKSILKELDVAAFSAAVSGISPMLAHNQFDAVGRFKNLQEITEHTELAGEIQALELSLRELRFGVVLKRLRIIVSRLENNDGGHHS